MLEMEQIESEGKVVKLGKESIHVIVLGFSSACITEEDIREDFKYKIKHGEEIYASSSQKRHVIKVGSMIRFLVKSWDEEILHISGSLVPSDTGSIRWLDKHGEEASESERIVNKRKDRETDTETIEHERMDGHAFRKNQKHKVKVAAEQ